MDQAVKNVCHVGDTKSQVLAKLGRPTSALTKGQSWKEQPGYPPCFGPDFNNDVGSSGTIAGPGGKRIPDPEDIESWTYFLGEDDDWDCTDLDIRFDRRGRVRKILLKDS
jgi:hypothetical protein